MCPTWTPHPLQPPTRLATQALQRRASRRSDAPGQASLPLQPPPPPHRRLPAETHCLAAQQSWCGGGWPCSDQARRRVTAVSCTLRVTGPSVPGGSCTPRGFWQVRGTKGEGVPKWVCHCNRFVQGGGQPRTSTATANKAGARKTNSHKGRDRMGQARFNTLQRRMMNFDR